MTTGSQIYRRKLSNGAVVLVSQKNQSGSFIGNADSVRPLISDNSPRTSRRARAPSASGCGRSRGAPSSPPRPVTRAAARAAGPRVAEAPVAVAARGRRRHGGGGGGDKVKPVIAALSASPRSSRVGTGATPTTGAALRAAKPKPATVLGYRLSEAASVKLTFLLQAKGKKQGKRCVKPTTKLRKAKARTRLTAVGSLRRSSKPGANKVPFTGRIGRKALKPGRYTVQAVATDGAGNVSATKPVTLTVKASKKKR